MAFHFPERLFFVRKNGNDLETEKLFFERNFMIFPEKNGKISLLDADASANQKLSSTSRRHFYAEEKSNSRCGANRHRQSAARTLSHVDR